LARAETSTHPPTETLAATAAATATAEPVAARVAVGDASEPASSSTPPAAAAEAASLPTPPPPRPTKSSTNGRQHRPRAPSNPMAPAFMVSAPGKVIVFGEHAVVHGKQALAASISLRSYLHVTTLSKSQRSVTLNFVDIGLAHTWPLDALPWAAFRAPGKRRAYTDRVTALDADLLAALRPHVVATTPAAAPDDVRRIHHASATAFLYLLLSLSERASPAAGAVYTLRSTIPIGAGLGSSASISVCLATALLLQARLLAGPHADQPAAEAETQLDRINRWAFVSECCIHGNPSGVDNTVSTGGKAVLFRRGDYAAPPTVTPLRDFPELPLLLVDSRQPRSTAREVAKVAELKAAFPQVVDCVLEAIDRISATAAEYIASMAGGQHSSGKDGAATTTGASVNGASEPSEPPRAAAVWRDGRNTKGDKTGCP
ncbi:Mevalonate kinase, partial [Ascosphaera acerosa]